MANISAKQVADLKAMTGAGLMDCKRALVDTEGDVDAAIKLLREKGLSAAAKKADRIAAEGVVDIMVEGNRAAMIEVNSETDFVAKNETFVEFVKGLLRTILAKSPKTVDEFKTLPFDGTEFTVAEALTDKIFVIKENISIRRFVIVEGITSTYIHGKGAIGVIVKFDADEKAVSNAGFAEFAKNIALQLAAYSTRYLDPQSVPADVLNEEKEIIAQQIKNDEKNAKKPDAIIEKMVIGRLGKFYEANCLTEQLYVKDDSMTVSKYVAATAKEFGGSIKLLGFERYEKGEGIQKREDDLAGEVAKMIAGN